MTERITLLEALPRIAVKIGWELTTPCYCLLPSDDVVSGSLEPKQNEKGIKLAVWHVSTIYPKSFAGTSAAKYFALLMILAGLCTTELKFKPLTFHSFLSMLTQRNV